MKEERVRRWSMNDLDSCSWDVVDFVPIHFKLITSFRMIFCALFLSLFSGTWAILPEDCLQ